MISRALPIVIMFLLTGLSQISGQRAKSPDSLFVVQLSGVVVTEEEGILQPLPYTSVYVKGTTRGTYSSEDGFFSLVVTKGEVVIFSAVGFKTIEYSIPDTLTANRYTLYQVMSKDNILLPETVIYPWPSKQHFVEEFVAMEVGNELEDNAQQNLSKAVIERLIQYLPSDGDENVDVYLRQQADSYVYEGQFKPIKILNVFAWKQFIDAWKRGDFKRKKKK